MEEKLSGIAPRITSIRKQKGITRENLAGEIGVSLSAVYSWEKGTKSPSIENFILLSKALGVTASELIGEEMTSDISKLSPQEKIELGKKLTEEGKKALKEEQSGYRVIARKWLKQAVAHQVDSSKGPVPKKEMLKALEAIAESLEKGELDEA